MAAPGRNYYLTLTVVDGPDVVVQRFAAGTAGAQGYTVNAAGPNTLILTRRYTPTWAIVVGVIGLLLFLIGVLAFFVKSTETLTVSAGPSPGGTVVTISGTATPELAQRLNVAVAGLTSATEQTSS